MMHFFSDPVLDAIAHRRSVSKVGPRTPSDEGIRELLGAVTHVADHKSLRPWRLILLRGDDRLKLGRALDAAQGLKRASGEVNPKPLRAQLLIALIASPVEHEEVPTWEQHATAAGAGHLLELALWQAGWGTMWRTGMYANASEVREAHGLADNELLMGWLYVGDIDVGYRQRLEESNRRPLDPDQFLGQMP
ncbi:nitroreductase family protein [Trueperella pyogenes]|uniref:nitroreductase family protein n=1 Tax=Trueperella pyogenes TaxID=1661 RepID=UPI00345DF1A1